MRCASCDTDTIVLESRRREDGTYRRRECPSCGARFSTMETVVGLKPGPKSQKPEAPAKPAKPKGIKPLPRKPAPARRVDDFWLRNETHDYHEDLKELGIDTTDIG